MSANHKTSESPTPNDVRHPPALASLGAIDAEIADHLATAAERLQSQGVGGDEAKSQAAEKFGDTEPVRRSCYWIQQGDSLMFRGAVIALLSILCLGLTITAVASWQSQARMAQQMTDLTAQLKAIAERPAAPPPVEPPLELKGHVYVGQPNRPAANQEVRILNVKDGSVVRRVRADAQGHYQSGPLLPGDYAIAGEIQGPRPGAAHYLQSAPAYAYPGRQVPACNLNLAYRAGRLQLELVRPLPTLTEAGKYRIDSRLMIAVYSEEWAYASPWTTQLQTPDKWPAYLESIVQPEPTRRGRHNVLNYFELLSNRDLNEDWSQTVFQSEAGLLPDGKATVVAALLVDVIPDKSKLPPLPVFTGPDPREGNPGGFRGFASKSRGRGESAPTSGRDAGRWRNAAFGAVVEEGRGPKSLISGSSWTDDNDDFFWITKGLGRLWLNTLFDPPEPRLPYPIQSGWTTWSERITVPVDAGQATRLLLDIPAEAAEGLSEFVKTANTAEEFRKRVPNYIYDDPPVRLEDAINDNNNPFVRPVGISVLGMQPLAQ